MEALEEAYEAELKEAGGKIKGVIEEALKLFDDDALLEKSIKYAMSSSKISMPKPQVLRF